MSRPLETHFAPPGIELLEEIGRGHFSIVFRGLKEGRTVAVKVQRESAAENDPVACAFRAEAAAVARVRHRAMPQILEVGHHLEHSYLVMEFVHGRTLAELIQRQRLEPREIVRIGTELSGVLAEVHRHGLVHRDVKPENVMVTGDGALTLIDFGLAADSSKGKSNVAGTFSYSPPEQSGVLDRTVDGRSDLYSLGVLMFQCVTGRLPYVATDAARLIQLHATEPIPSARALNDSVPRALDAVIAKLLAKDPDDRYQSAQSLALDFERLASPAASRDATFELGTGDGGWKMVREEPLVGREVELRELQATWKAARAGRGGAILVTGESGMGKSRLVQELLRHADSDGGLVLCGKCVAGESVPLAPLRQAIGEYLARVHRLPAAQREEVHQKLVAAAGEFAPQLVRFHPALRQVLGESGAGISLSQDLFHEAIASFLAAVADLAPTVLFIDDVQWMDDQSRSVLQRALTRTGKARLVTVFAARSDPESAAALDRFRHTVTCSSWQELTVRPLDGGGIAAMIGHFLGGDGADATLVAHLQSRSGGSPFAVRQLLHTVLDEGLLRPFWGRWTYDVSGLERLSIPDDIVPLVLRRAERMHSNVFVAAAILGNRFDPKLLGEMTGLPTHAVQHALTEAAHAQLVQPELGGWVSFSHDRIREAMLTALSGAEASALHLRAAEAMERAPALDEYAIARHRMSGAPEAHPAEVFRACVAAGLKALEGYAHRDALEFLTCALAHSAAAKQPFNGQLHRALGTAHAGVGDVPQAVVHLAHARSASDSALERAGIEIQLSLVFLFSNDAPKAWKHIEQGFRELGIKLPSEPLEPEAAPGAAANPDPVATVHLALQSALYTIGFYVAYFMMDPLLQYEMGVRGLKVSEKLGPCREAIGGYFIYGMLMGVMQQKEVMEAYCGRAIRDAEQIGDRHLIARSHLYYAWAVHFSGESRRGEALMRECMRMHSRWFDTADIMNGNGDLAWNLLTRGKAREALEVINTAMVPVSRENDMPGHPHLAYAAHPLAMTGRPAEAAALLNTIEAIAERYPSDLYRWALLLGARLAVLLEQEDLGTELDEVFAAHKQLGIGPAREPIHSRYFYIYLAYVRVLGVKKASPAQREAALAKLEEAMVLLEQAATLPMFRAHLAVVQAAHHRLHGRNDSAEAALQTAETLARQVDNPWAAFEAALERAALLTQEGNLGAAERELGSAFVIATSNGWTNRARRVLSISQTTGSASQASALRVHESLSRVASAPGRSSSGGAPGQLQRQLDALLEVSTAACSMDAVIQARATLDVIVRLCHAERGYLFRSEGDARPLALSSGRTAQGEDLPMLSGYSSTVVEMVRTTKKPLIVNGTEEGAILGSESAVAHNLRSIVAAPLQLQDEFFGVIYLDTRVAKGVFTENDLQVLNALGNHIAIAFKMLEAARTEANRKELAKDLEVTRSVQTLLLPPTSARRSGRARVSSLYRPATQSGGDWFWIEEGPDAKLSILLGDVSGHGAGSAMVTAAVASAYHAQRRLAPGHDVEQVLNNLHLALREITREAYGMTATVAVCDTGSGRVTLWSAGAPPAFVVSSTGTVSTLMARGAVLGSSDFAAERIERQLEVGDRLVLFTDGLTEIKDGTGRQMNLKRLSKLLAQSAQHPFESLGLYWGETIDGLLSEDAQEDDITATFLEWS